MHPQHGSNPGGYAVNHYLTDTNAFYIITDIPNGMKHFERTALETSMDGDFYTGNVRYKARERYSLEYLILWESTDLQGQAKTLGAVWLSLRLPLFVFLS